MVMMVDIVNRLLTPAVNLVCWPFKALPPIWAITAISLVSGVGMVWVFGKVSDQTTIKKARERIRGNLIGVRLFQRDIAIVLRLQRRIFGDTFSYLRHAMWPMVVLLLPVVLIMTQLNLRFSVRPLDPDEPALVKVYFRDATTLDQNVKLEVGDGVTLETRGVRIPSTKEIAWRVSAAANGEHLIVVRVGAQTLETHLIAGGQWRAIPQRRTGRGIWDTLLYPGEPPIPSNHLVEAVEIVYPVLDIKTFGWSINWLMAFFFLSIVFGFAFKNVLGVEI